MHDPTPAPDDEPDYSAAKRRVEDQWNGKLSEEELAKRHRQIRRAKANANRRPGKGKSALKQAAALLPMRQAPLNEDQIAALRRQNAGCDLAIAQAVGSPGAVTVWTAHGQRSSLFIVVITPKEGEEGEPQISVDYVDGGTEWDRKQKLTKAVHEAINRGKELGYQAVML